MRLTTWLLIAAFIVGAGATQAIAQEKDKEKEATTTGREKPDPTLPSKQMKELSDKIRGVAELDALKKELQKVRSENAKLLATIDTLRKEIATQKTSLPKVQLKARAIANDRAIVQLTIGDSASWLVRQGSEVNVPLANGDTTVMKVLQIDAEGVELDFPDLKKKLTLID